MELSWPTDGPELREVGPGLALCLTVGVKKALAIAAEHGLPVVKVHHMEAHAMVTRRPCPGVTTPEFPFLTLTKFPPGFVIHLGGMVSSKSVKLMWDICR